MTTTQLSTRAAHPQGATTPPSQSGRHRSRRWWILLLVPLLALLLPVSAVMGAWWATSAWVGGGTADSIPSNSGSERVVARSASLSLRVDDPMAAADAAGEVAGQKGGWVQWESISSEGSSSGASATMTLHVPADALEETLDALEGLGTVIIRQSSVSDVTNEVADLTARIDAGRAAVKRMQELMDQAGTVEEVVAVEAELSSRQADLQALEAQKASYDSTTEFALITLQMDQAGATSVNPFLGGLEGGWTALQNAARLLVILLGGVLPFAAVAAVIAAPLVWWRRHRAGRGMAAEGADERGAPELRGAPDEQDS